MRGRYLLVLLVLLLPTTQCGLSPLSDGPEVQTHYSDIGGGEAVLMVEVSPVSPSEYVILHNNGSDADLTGWYLSDGEGKIVIVNATLRQGEMLALASDSEAFLLIHPEVRCIAMSSEQVYGSGRFTLADAGDMVSLYDD